MTVDIIHEWQPIETAPRDGTVLLLYSSNHSDVWQQRLAYWATGPREGWYGRGGPAYATDGAFSHWMPLPEPPK